jgi:UPF0755 protein
VAAQLGLKENVHQVVTMASLVERETAVDAERPLVASVFENRLAKNMPLNDRPRCDLRAGTRGQVAGAIYASDLTRDTPYNTYLHAGLPPGPVANPGMKSLRAAMDPAKRLSLLCGRRANAQGHSLFAEHARRAQPQRGRVPQARAEERQVGDEICIVPAAPRRLRFRSCLRAALTFPTTRHLPVPRSRHVNRQRLRNW